ncbi:hypothetical protein AFK68_29900 [Hydrocoleum sp. CS-953]|uniref:hypothetical protein n=1 Tax=Hydrocoleum sp. CS-953 TaxID=1671698 RepID=UPI000B9A6254|nr:hypothetical protein [Hydrocoleum sp. CS-953]OZH51601.1 hypothetical protein AFK68_29900 [Hydrocoleum sp. CS-953]
MQQLNRQQIPIFCLIFLPVLFMGICILKYSVNFPFSDQWPLAIMFEKIYTGNLSFSDLFAQFHESRKFFPRLIFIGLAYLTNWDVRYEMLVIFLLTCIVSLNIYWLSRLTVKGSFVTQFFLLVISNLLIFSPAQYENWLWGIQVVVYIPIACLTGCLVIAQKKLSLRTKFIICFFLCTVSTFSYANGMLTWVLVFPGLGILASGKWQEIFTKNIWIIIGGLLGFVGNVVLYFYDYQKPDKHPSFLSAISHPVDTFHYFLVFLGAPLGFENLTVATIVGGLVFSSWMFLFWQFFRLVKTDFLLLHRLIVWLIIGIYAIISGAVTAVGRVGFGVGQALAPRYTAFSLYLMVSLIYLLAIFWQLVSQNNTRKNLIRYSSLLLISVFLVLHINTTINAVDRMNDRRVILLQSKACLLMINVIHQDECLVMKRSSEPLKKTANILDKLGFLQPGLIKSKNIQDIAQESKSDLIYGYFDTVNQIDNQTYIANGWAILPERGEVADGVILTYENAEGEAIIFKLINQRMPRPSVREYFNNSTYLYSGWQKYFSVREIPQGTVKLKAWAFDTETGKAFLLNKTQVIFSSN